MERPGCSLCATVAAIHCHGPSYRFPGDADADAITSRVRDAARAVAEVLP